jgi:hypothetical protein
VCDTFDVAIDMTRIIIVQSTIDSERDVYLSNSVDRCRLVLDNKLLVPGDLDELYQLYARDIDEGQLIHDLKSKSLDNEHVRIVLLSTIVSSSFAAFDNKFGSYDRQSVDAIELAVSHANCRRRSNECVNIGDKFSFAD